MIIIQIKIPVFNEEGKIQPHIIEAEDIFNAMEIARDLKLEFVDNYIAVCWYNGESIN